MRFMELMGVPMLHFVANTVRPSLRRAPRVCALLLAANALAQGVARLAFGFRLIDMLPVTHVLMALSVGAMIGRSSARIRRRARQERARLPSGVHHAGQLQHGRAGAVLGVSRLLV